MATYLPNEGYTDEKTIDANGYETNGDFVDFFVTSDGAPSSTKQNVFRIRADRVSTIELKS